MTERIPVSKIRYGHSPDKRGERKDKYGRQPIEVYENAWGEYVAQDGNDRLYYARERGDRHIDAVVVQREGCTSGCLSLVLVLGALGFGLARMLRR